MFNGHSRVIGQVNLWPLMLTWTIHTCPSFPGNTSPAHPRGHFSRDAFCSTTSTTSSRFFCCPSICCQCLTSQGTLLSLTSRISSPGSGLLFISFWDSMPPHHPLEVLTALLTDQSRNGLTSETARHEVKTLIGKGCLFYFFDCSLQFVLIESCYPHYCLQGLVAYFNQRLKHTTKVWTKWKIVTPPNRLACCIIYDYSHLVQWWNQISGSLSVPTKFVPLSLITSFGPPPAATTRLNAFLKSVVLCGNAISRWTDLVAAQVKRQISLGRCCSCYFCDERSIIDTALGKHPPQVSTSGVLPWFALLCGQKWIKWSSTRRKRNQCLLEARDWENAWKATSSTKQQCRSTVYNSQQFPNCECLYT